MVAEFPDRLVTRVEFAFGADLTADPATWMWTDVTERRQAQSIAITRGRKNEGATAQPSSITVTLDNLDGALTPDQPTSPYYPHVVEGTPLRFSIQWEGVWYTRFVGETDSWEPDWPYGDLSDEASGYLGEARVTVTANGIMRRLEQGTKPLRDALRRHIEAAGPLAYWPLTDGQTAREGSEVLGGQPMRSVGESGSFFQGQPGWAKGELASWLDPVVQLPNNTTGRIRARVTHADVDAWTVDHYVAGGGTAYVNNCQIFDTGTGSDGDPRTEWSIGTDAFFDVLDLVVVSREETSSSSTLLASPTGIGIFDRSPHMIRLTTADDGVGGTDWELFIDGVSIASGTHALQHRAVDQITYRWNLEDINDLGETEAMPLGHITYWGPGEPTAADTYRAMLGHVRELAGRRIERLCQEQDVPLSVNGDLDQTPPMGPQSPGAFLELLQTAADVDGGVLYEARDAPSLEYRTRASKYNQGV